MSTAPSNAADEPAPAHRSRGWSGARAAMDGIVCLALAVLVLRTFLVEGYMISTGSMAPTLYGYHKRVVCPTCHHVFARGVAFDGSATFADTDEDQLQGGGVHATCPNCGQTEIDVRDVPRNHGDQLLVLKHAYDFRPPRRWEIVVFRNPNHPTETFVKRVAGLPGESIHVIDGEVYTDGKICRKSFEDQRSTRIPVFTSDHVPDDMQRWLRGKGWRLSRDSGAPAYTFSSPDGRKTANGTGEEPELSWLAYRHVLRTGGNHETTVRVRSLPLEFDWQAMPGDAVRLELDPDVPGTGTLVANGAITSEWERRLREITPDPAFQSAVTQFVEDSRSGPVTDRYAYNRLVGTLSHVVRDLAVEFRLSLDDSSSFAVRMTDGNASFRLVLDGKSRMSTLFDETSHERLRTATLPDAILSEEGAVVEMSLFDRQVSVAFDRIEPFAAWSYDAPAEWKPPTAVPVKLGAAGGFARVESLTIYRDVYYTRGKGRNGINKPYRLGDDEYFVLGDNSPVSLDSRSWPDGAVPDRYLLGKPFVVHLPSRPGTLRLGNRTIVVRIPDFERIRYIR